MGQSIVVKRDPNHAGTRIVVRFSRHPAPPVPKSANAAAGWDRDDDPLR
jgi:hypothetical protein